MDNLNTFFIKCSIVFFFIMLGSTLLLGVIHKNRFSYEFLDDHHRANKVTGSVETYSDYFKTWN